MLGDEKKKSLQTGLISITNSNKEVLKRLVHACFPVSYSEEFYGKVVNVYNNLARFIVLKDVIVGAVACRVENEEITNTPHVHVMILLVLDKYRRLGLAHIMLNFIYDEIKKLTIKPEYLSLHVQKANEVAVKFYLKEGFSITEELENYYTDIENGTAYYMKKEL